MNNQLTTVDDFVIEGFRDARDTLFEVFGTSDIAVLEDYSKLLAAMRMMPKQILDQAAKPIILRLFQEFKADPETPEGRAKVVPFVDILALSVQDAHQVILGQVEQQQRSRQALATGRGNLLKG